MKVLYIGGDTLATGASFSMIKLIEEEEKLGIDVVPVVHKGNSEKLLSQKGRSHYIVNAWSWRVSLNAPWYKVLLIHLIKGILNIPCYFRYKKIIKVEKPDIVHINALTTYVGAMAAARSKKPLVWHIREMMEEDLNSQFWNKPQAYNLMKKADCFIAISKCVEKKYRAIVGDDHIRCIYNGVDKDLFYNKEHTILTKQQIVLTMAGRITEKKGQFQCLKSLAPLLQENPNIILQFAGTGSDADLEKIINIRNRSGLCDSQVQILGFVKEMNRLWASTDIAIVYSSFEAFGRVTVEAKMAGALVVGFDSGGTSELIEDGIDGYLFDDNKCNLYSTMNKLLSDKELSRTIAARGRELAAKTFTSENNAKQVVDLYKSVLQQSKNKGK